MTQLLPDIFAIEVPEDAWDFEFKESEIQERWILTYKTKFRWEKYGNENWKWEAEFEEVPEILFTTKPNNEADAEKVVASFEPAGEKGYRDYLWGRELRYPFKHASSSLLSLLSANGLDPSKNYLLIKKQQQ